MPRKNISQLSQRRAFVKRVIRKSKDRDKAIKHLSARLYVSEKTILRDYTS